MAIIENINVSSPNDGLGDSLRDSQIKANNNFTELNDKKVEKVAGKDLSANDFTDILKTKLDGIEDGADVQIQSDWNQTNNLAKDFIKNKPDLSQYFSAVGYFDYNDLATATTPLNYTTGLLQLSNDTLGTYTSTNFPPYGVSGVWDSLTNTFNFSELSIGDEVLLRVHISITTSGANQISGLRLLFGEGTANEFTLPIDINIEHRSAGIHDIVKEISFYIGNEDWRITPVKLQFNSSASATVKVFGWHPYIIRRSVNILDINDDNYKTFTIINIEADNDDTTVIEGGVSIGYNSLTNKINSILFDIPFSSYIYNYDQLSGVYDFSVNFVDKSNGKSFTSFITGFNTFGSHYKLDLQETLDYTEYSITDKIELFIQAQIHNPSIDDTAGDGVLNKSWSANKLFDEFALKESLANKGVANGYAPLNASVKIDSTYLPSYVDDVIEVADFASLPLTGEAGKIYVTLDTEKIYRWSGSVYVEISPTVIPDLQSVTDVGATTTNQVNIDTTVSSPNDYGFLVKSQNQYAIGGQSVSNTGVAGSSTSGAGVFGGSVSGVGGSFDSSSANIIELKQNSVLKGYVNGDGDIKIRGILDTNNVLGTSGQILSSTGSGVDWIDSNSFAWSLTGNAGTNPATNFIGTTDNVDFIIRTNNTNKATITTLGQLIIGDNLTPTSNTNRKLVVDGASGMLLRNLNAGNPLAYTVIRNSGTLFEIANEVGDFILGNFSATNGMLFRVGGIERARFLATGNLGIGTNAPTKTLDINGELRIRTLPTGLSTENILVVNGSGDVRSISPTAYTRNLYDIDGTLSGNRIVTQGTNTLSFTSNAVNSFSVDGTTFSVDTLNNFVGIGTSTPAAKLDVQGGAGGLLLYAENLGSLPNSFYDAQRNTGKLGIGWNYGGGPGELDFISNRGLGAVGGFRFYDVTNTANTAPNHLMTIEGNTGNVGIGTASPTAALDINSNILRLRTAKTPSSATDTGNAGDICWDTNYVYVCTATNTWKRTAIATW